MELYPKRITLVSGTNAIIHSTDICLAEVSTTEFEQLTGNKRYEFSNHQRDVMVVVTDRRIAVDNGNNGSIDYYRAEVSMATDYYPFGMGMVERSCKSDIFLPMCVGWCNMEDDNIY